jgi:hypothetical protein
MSILPFFLFLQARRNASFSHLVMFGIIVASYNPSFYY